MIPDAKSPFSFHCVQSVINPLLEANVYHCVCTRQPTRLPIEAVFLLNMEASAGTAQVIFRVNRTTDLLWLTAARFKGGNRGIW
jgi:hypothetical protein